MEQLQVHSRSYIVRWIRVKSGESISWSLQPHKKSLNFGIFKHPGGVASVHSNLPTSATLEPPPTPTDNGVQRGRRNSKAMDKDALSNVVEKLQSIGLKCVSWTGNCEADQVSMGTYDVHEGEDGMYGLVFDNTFSKTVSKTATFVLLTHATNAPPKSGVQLRYSNAQAATSSSTLGKSPSLCPTSGSTDSLHHELPAYGAIPTLKIPRRGSALSLAGSFYTGVMHKKRRKKNQGYARRFFSLDFTTSTLSYYRNSHASALRGSIPLSLASIGADEHRKEFSIDSGAEVWHLRLRNKKDFDTWQRAFERATSTRLASPLPVQGSKDFAQAQPTAPVDPLAEREWQRVEELIGRVSGTRDAVRRLAQDTDPKYTAAQGNHVDPSPGTSPVHDSPFFPDTSVQEPQRLPFWKRKPSSGSQGGSPSSLLRRSFSAQGSLPVAPTASQPPSPLVPIPKIKAPTLNATLNEDIHNRCMALLHDLDTTVSEFSTLLAECKSRRLPAAPITSSRLSMESSRSDDFFDAEEAVENTNQIFAIHHSDDITEQHDDFYSDEASITSSDAGGAPTLAHVATTASPESVTVFPTLPRVLTPASIPSVPHRDNIPAPRQPPPSIIGFLRKNAGKDLSTVAMPVTANEPTSLLQRLAEPLENAHLLSLAAASTGESHSIDRLVLVSAFAISSFASNRIKERAVRKPFNPMLGETFELVRHENGSASSSAYRFLAEKVTHHPVRMAWQANSLSGAWSLAQSPRPVQKFWGKSVELNTDGKVFLSLHDVSGSKSPKVNGDGPGRATSEHFTWTQPTTYLRNVIAGEKYVEPVGTLTITNETTGEKAVATFKAAGLFSGRSEDVTVAFYAPASSTPLSITLAGKWTTSLTRSDSGAEVWRAGPTTPDAAKSWGFPVFSAQLNEITPIEDGKMARTDSRLRPDQRAFEEGHLDEAEGLKARLEERQRSRRKVLESHGGTYTPRYFQKIEVDLGEEEEEVWRLKTGPEGYWECRERVDWSGSMAIFEV